MCDYYFGVVGFWIYAKEHREKCLGLIFFNVELYAEG